ncbi:MAG: T9SS type A sorting domain-containing protein, partial [Paludibacter sp.]
INGGKTVYFKVKNVSGESPTFSANITLNETTTILSAIDNENDIISVFPNPIKSIATLNFVNKNTEKENYTVEILSLTGVSLEKSIQNATSVQLDFSNYPAGTYILRLKGSKNVYSRKVVKH